jgi:short-subunit dehydrogenase
VSSTTRSAPLAVVTGASSGIGLELAKKSAVHGYGLIIAAEDSALNGAARELTRTAPDVTAVQTDLADFEGVERLCAAIECVLPSSKTVGL